MGDTANDGGQLLVDLLEFLDAVASETLLSTSDSVFKLLGDEQRRHLVLYLTEQDTVTPLSRVALEITSRCNDTPYTDITPAEQERTRFRLEQEHLPRLADYDILSWSYGDDMVEPIPKTPFGGKENEA
ncbi:hypothetical protein SAMN05421858_1232 [Haladaptatus litoreus]|uniref:DUF7344 domain-containing protein n=1 Tax=Haladaptatus litoreus TaxID=553468 RepID=A0A1N6XQJ0_9EURY|nr:hypothetical protein [Haladaptatus litoreus]SIR04590.1 hypothetical protein SAMN05421858_1232 [Haladaptatus litoreus]